MFYCLIKFIKFFYIIRRNFFESQMNVVKTVEHWHSLPVRSLTFSAEGIATLFLTKLLQFKVFSKCLPHIDILA